VNVKQLRKQTLALKAKAKAAVVGPKSPIIRQLSEAYYREVLNNLGTGKYPKENASPSSYNQRYLEWKIENYGFTDPWYLSGELGRNIRLFNRLDVALVGIPSGIYDRGGKSWLSSSSSKKGPPKEITWYGYKLEFGDAKNNQPPRPVFTPTLSDLYNSPLNNLILARESDKVLRTWLLKR
jgi:phage gpG-like protein